MTQEQNIADAIRKNEIKAIGVVQKDSKAKQGAAYATSEECDGCKVGKKIIISLKNLSTTNTKRIFFGTPFGVSDEAVLIPSIWSPIVAASKDWDRDLSKLEDNFGLEAKFLQLINKRFLRRAVLVHQMQMITDNELQRQESLIKYNVPLNAPDAHSNADAFQAVYTEYNGTQMIQEPVVFGDFGGVAFDLLPDTEVRLNIMVSAVDSLTFKV